ncbi:hypothetical protein [Wenxinia saemankumensis]|uniref:Flagellar export protein FliJ n=1 Tax=Wenxinia saemankumensis TaxID=1447782 RepID=A0A1M6G695_9RHOB|nr:hypothetical protein [Wenxinia saemankumensis]SHJ05496.1 hypothetical protein SAMN05444417_2709 [Wenxinia saemankumensis]
MKARVSDLRGLLRLAGAQLQAERARMGRLAAEAERIRARLAAIEADRRAQLVDLRADDIFVRSGAALDWQRWIDARKALLTRDLARVRAGIEEGRPALARAVGREHAVRALLDEAGAEARRARSRRD